MMKPSAWLNDYLHSHDIVSSQMAKDDFTKETGLGAPEWPEYSPEQTLASMRQRGLGGSLSNKADKKLAYGWLVAIALAKKYAPNSGEPWQKFQGRGWQFRAAAEALEKAGY